MRGQESQYYSYEKAVSVDDVEKMSGGVLGEMVYHTRLVEFAEGDLISGFDRNEVWIREDGSEEVFDPHIDFVVKLRKAYTDELKGAIRWARKLGTSCEEALIKSAATAQEPGNYDVLLKVILKKQENIDQIDSRMKNLFSKRRMIDMGNRFRKSWFDKNHPDMNEFDFIDPQDEEMSKLADNYFRGMAAEYRQYLLMRAGYDFFMPKIKKEVSDIILLMDKGGFGDITDSIIVNEYNRLRKQARQEQERRIS